MCHISGLSDFTYAIHLGVATPGILQHRIIPSIDRQSVSILNSALIKYSRSFFMVETIPQSSLFTYVYLRRRSFSTFATKRIGSRSPLSFAWLITRPIPVGLDQPLLLSAGCNPASSVTRLPVVLLLASSLLPYVLTSIRTSSLFVVDGRADLRCGHSVESRYGRTHMFRVTSGLPIVIHTSLSSTESRRP